MKKIFTLVFALMGFAGAASAATVDDLAVLKHSYVLVCDQLGARPGKGVLFGDDHFLDVKSGGTTATNKGEVDLSVVNEADDNHVTQAIVDKYGADYAGPHYNWLRLKNQQDMIALKLTAKSKIIIFEQGNNKSGTAARIPRISTDEAQSNSLNAAPGEDHPATDSGFRWEFTVDDDGLYYLGSYNGDMFISYIIIEANEAPGTPTVKVGAQTYENGLWFREVSATANNIVEEGSTESIPTVLTYTTDGSAPTAASPKYTEPIKCYANTTVKFQAFMDFGDHTPSDDMLQDGADNEGNVNFSFDAPAIAADGASFTITSPYAEQGGTNFYTLNGGEEAQGDGTTLTESAIVAAYTKIVNGDYGTFTSKSSSKDVYVLNPIKEAKTIKVVSADVVVDEEATAASTDGSKVYKVENGVISADKADFFVKNLSWSVLKDEKAQYQVPEGQEAYIQMSNTNIVFKVAAGDKVKVKVTTTKNSCKNIDAEDAAEDKQVNGCTPDRMCYVNVSGTNYCLTDAEGNVTNDLKLYPDANVFEFELEGAKTTTTKDADGNDVTETTAQDMIYTFQKYSGTGNILISSIEIAPAEEAAEEEIVLWEGEAVSTGWANQPTLLSDGGAELTEAGAAVGDVIRFYCTAPDDNWQCELTEGHWGGIIYRYAAKDLGPNADGSERVYEIVDISKGYIDLVITEDILTKATTQQWWGGVFLLNGDGGLTVTKLTLIKKGGADAIQTAKTVNTVNGVRYNLAGQKVDENYKGIVILNGKKFMQK